MALATSLEVEVDAATYAALFIILLSTMALLATIKFLEGAFPRIVFSIGKEISAHNHRVDIAKRVIMWAVLGLFAFIIKLSLF